MAGFFIKALFEIHQSNAWTVLQTFSIRNLYGLCGTVLEIKNPVLDWSYCRRTMVEYCGIMLNGILTSPSKTEP